MLYWLILVNSPTDFYPREPTERSSDLLESTESYKRVLNSFRTTILLPIPATRANPTPRPIYTFTRVYSHLSNDVSSRIFLYLWYIVSIVVYCQFVYRTAMSHLKQHSVIVSYDRFTITMGSCSASCSSLFSPHPESWDHHWGHLQMHSNESPSQRKTFTFLENVSWVPSLT